MPGLLFQVLIFAVSIGGLLYASNEASPDSKPLTICGHSLEELSDLGARAHVATTASPYDAFSGFSFPTLAAFSSVLATGEDRIQRVGATRMGLGDLHYFDTNREPGNKGYSDLAVAYASGQMVAATVDQSGEVSLQVNYRAQITRDLGGNGDSAFKALVLPSARASGQTEFNEPFRSVALHATDTEGQLELVGLTDNGLYHAFFQVDARLSGPAHWKKLGDVSGARWVRSLGWGNGYVLGSLKGDVWQGNYSDSGFSLSPLPSAVGSGGWLLSISAYLGDAGKLRIAALTQQGPEAAPKVQMYKQYSASSKAGTWEPLALAFPNGETPVALALSGLAETPPGYLEESRRRAMLNVDGYFTESVGEGTEVRRLLLVCKSEQGFRLRGVQRWVSGTPAISQFPWFYSGPSNPTVVRDMTQAGFDMDLLRQHKLDFVFDVGHGASRLAAFLEDGHGFTAYDSKVPELYRGSPQQVVAQWLRRLELRKDLNTPKSKVAEELAGLGISSARSQLLAYELIKLDEEIDDGNPLSESLKLDPTDSEWLSDFQAKLRARRTSFNLRADRLVTGLEAFEKKVNHLSLLDQGSQEDAARWDAWEEYFSYSEGEMSPAYLVYLASHEYLKRPFRYVFADFKKYVQGKEASVTELEFNDLKFIDLFAEFLETQDPLQSVSNSQSLIDFFNAPWTAAP